MLREVVPIWQRGRAFGVQGSVIGVGAGLGPVIGGLATAAFGWRAIFGVNLPVVIAVLALLRHPVTTIAASPAPSTADPPEESPRLVNAVFGAAFCTQALSTFAQYGLLLGVPIVLHSRGQGAAAIGAAVSAMTLGMVVTGPYGGRLGDVRGRRRPVVLGLVITLLAIAAAAAGGDDVPSAVLLASLVVSGIGQGVASPSVMTAGIEAAPPARIGSAAGLLSASRYVGSITSTLVLARLLGDDGSGFAALLTLCVASLAVCVAVARRLPGPIVAAPELVG
jgi:DHA2 family methylenomycin A resistance protein-like MFS transporter